MIVLSGRIYNHKRKQMKHPGSRTTRASAKASYERWGVVTVQSRLCINEGGFGPYKYSDDTSIIATAASRILIQQRGDSLEREDLVTSEGA